VKGGGARLKPRTTGVSGAMAGSPRPDWVRTRDDRGAYVGAAKQAGCLPCGCVRRGALNGSAAGPSGVVCPDSQAGYPRHEGWLLHGLSVLCPLIPIRHH